MWMPAKSPPSRASTRTPPPRSRAAPANISPGSRPRTRSRRKELGVDDDLKEIDGVTTAMLVAFGENDVKTVEDLAGCATDDLVGWTEGRGPEATRYKGALDGFDISRADAENMIMAARVKAGWIEQPEEIVETEGSAEEAETEAQPS